MKGQGVGETVVVRCQGDYAAYVSLILSVSAADGYLYMSVTQLIAVIVAENISASGIIGLTSGLV